MTKISGANSHLSLLGIPIKSKCKLTSSSKVFDQLGDTHPLKLVNVHVTECLKAMLILPSLLQKPLQLICIALKVVGR